jgi:hypothetical protein
VNRVDRTITGQSGNELARVRRVSRSWRSRCAEAEFFHAEAQRWDEKSLVGSSVRIETLWKWRAVENVENQTAVSHFSHRPWKSQTTRFPHSHSGGDGPFSDAITPPPPGRPRVWENDKTTGGRRQDRERSRPTSGEIAEASQVSQSRKAKENRP